MQLLHSFDLFHCDLDLLPLSEEKREELRKGIISEKICFAETEDLKKYLTFYYITALRDSPEPYLYEYENINDILSITYSDEDILQLKLDNAELYKWSGNIRFTYTDYYSFNAVVLDGIVKSITHTPNI